MLPGSNAILLLRGLGREQRHWGSFPETLSSAFHCPVYCLDLPGAGSECGREAPSNMNLIVEDVRKRWLLLPRAENFHCIAISLGGMLSLSWCKHYPEDFKSLFLINSSLSGLSPFWRRLRPIRYPQLLKSFFLNHPVDREKLILDMTTKVLSESQKIEVAQVYAQHFLNAPLKRRNFLKQLLAAIQFRLEAPPAKPIQKVVIASRQDGFTHSSCSDALAKFLGAKIIWNEKAGHDLPVDDPKWLVECLLQELSG